MKQQQFIEGMSHAVCTVSVITTDGPHGRAGVTVSAMTSISAEPPTLLVCVHQQSPACDKLKQNGVLCVNVLSEDQSWISDTFAGRLKPPGEDKFSCATWVTQKTGAPNLEDALIAFDCNISQFFQVGSHFVFIAEPLDIRMRQSGHALIYANRAYGTARQLDQFVGQDIKTTAEQVLKVGCFTTIGPFFIPRLVSSFLNEYPETRFEFFEGSEQEIETGIKNKRFDLVLMYDSPTVNDPTKIELARTAPHVLLPAKHPLAKNRVISLKKLAQQPMVLLDIPPSRDYFILLFQEHDIEPTIRFRSPSFETVRGMVANGLGYSLLISKPANNMSYDGNALVSRPIKEPVTSGSLILRKPTNAANHTSMVNLFHQHCQKFFADWGI